MKRFFLSTLALGIILTGCTSKISKSNITTELRSFNYYKINKAFEKCKQWNCCFDISEKEFKETINESYRFCIDQEKKNFPKMLNWRQQTEFRKNVDICAMLRFF